MHSDRGQLMSEQGWTPIPNHVLDQVYRFNPVQFKILMYICRRLYGWDKPHSDFSVRFLSDHTGIAKSTVQRHLDKMIATGILLVAGKGTRGVRKLMLAPPPECTTNTPETTDSRVISISTVPSNAVRSPYHPSVQPNRKIIKNSVRTINDLSQNRNNINSDLFKSLEKHLSALSLRRIMDSFVKVESGTWYFSYFLPSNLQFILTNISGFDVRFVSSKDAQNIAGT